METALESVTSGVGFHTDPTGGMSLYTVDLSFHGETGMLTVKSISDGASHGIEFDIETVGKIRGASGDLPDGICGKDAT